VPKGEPLLPAVAAFAQGEALLPPAPRDPAPSPADAPPPALLSPWGLGAPGA
jgi:hypothetical protein